MNRRALSGTPLFAECTGYWNFSREWAETDPEVLGKESELRKTACVYYMAFVDITQAREHSEKFFCFFVFSSVSALKGHNEERRTFPEKIINTGYI